MEKPGTLFLFQIDHLSGEEVGCLVEQLYGWGAKNVNVISTLTKKNRPGYLILVDAGCMDTAGLPEKMARLFGTCGCHRFETNHLCLSTDCRKVSLTVRCGDRLLDEELEVKVIGEQDSPLSKRPEYDSLMNLCRRLEHALGFTISLPKLRRSVEAGLKSGDPLEIQLDPRERNDSL
jgi:uncharacterized protein (DUF111 family)